MVGPLLQLCQGTARRRWPRCDLGQRGELDAEIIALAYRLRGRIGSGHVISDGKRQVVIELAQREPKLLPCHPVWDSGFVGPFPPKREAPAVPVPCKIGLDVQEAAEGQWAPPGPEQMIVRGAWRVQRETSVQISGDEGGEC